MKNHELIYKFSRWLIVTLTPLIILMIAVRVLISPLFPRIEYRLPGFPDDPYGFTLSDRLRWSAPTIKYLLNSEDISYLESLRFDNGEPIYNVRELSHMEDVKAVVSGMRIGLSVGLLILLTITIFAVKNGQRTLIIQAYRTGAWGIFGLIVTILIFVVISFSQLFTWFHQLFFTSGTWQFYTSDTLIRLFPMRFWRDAFIFVGGLSLLFGGGLLLLTKQNRQKITN